MVTSSFSEQERAIYSDGFKLGMQVVFHNSDPLTITSTFKLMYESIDDLIESLSNNAKRNNISIDCKAGCEWCCHQPVFCHTYEIQYVLDFINTNLKKQIIQEILNKAKKKNSITKNLEKVELLNYKSPCPLLNSGKCLAYQARPMACRIYLSTNIFTCKHFYFHPEDQKSFPALLAFPLKAGRLINEGFIAALKENNIFCKEYTLEKGLMKKNNNL